MKQIFAVNGYAKSDVIYQHRLFKMSKNETMSISLSNQQSSRIFESSDAMYSFKTKL